MDQLKSSAEKWTKFALRGTALIAAVTAVFFWNSSHSVEDISLGIAVPLIISNCLPAFLIWPLSYIPQPQEGSVAKPFSSLPARARIIVIIAGIFLGLVILGFVAGLSILLASYVYQGLGIVWAVAPARHLARSLLLVSAFPLVMSAGFVSGVYCSLRIRQSAIWDSLFSTTTKTLREWPKAA